LTLKKGQIPNTIFVFGVTLAIGVFVFFRIFHSIKQIINEKKQAEEKLEDYAFKLERSNKDLEDFAYIASHDLQEPLRKIIVFGDRLNSKIPNTDEQGRDYLKRMQNSALSMKEFIQDLIQFTKIERQAKPFETVDLKEVVREVLGNLEVRIQETKGVVNIMNLPVVEADRMQMYQLFLNLIGNALKFHREGIPPVVNLDCTRKENGFLEISVEDNGIGIKAEHVDKIFKPFERLHGRSTYEGTGIGLTICNRIVMRHGGEITVKRQSKNGITFHIILSENNKKE
jgi:light-regulated signal transduction histidine kinase (bacteriophytochrome)